MRKIIQLIPCQIGMFRGRPNVMEETLGQAKPLEGVEFYALADDGTIWGFFHRAGSARFVRVPNTQLPQD